MSRSLVEKAFRCAVKAHEGQVRDEQPSVPYALHVADVMTKLRLVGRVNDPEQLAAALLHDTIEMSNLDPDRLRRKFGPRVAGLVVELTRYEPTEAERKGLTSDQVYALRSALLLSEIRKMSPDAQRIKLADRLSNLEEAVVTRSGLKFERFLAQTRSILDIIPREVSPELWDAIRSRLDLEESNAGVT